MKSIHFLFRTAVLALFLLGSAAGAWAQNVFPVVTGEHWLKASPEERLAFVSGMATMIELEKEVQAKDQATPGKSLVSSWITGLSPYKLTDIVAIIDGYYAKEPGRLNRSVVEVMWFEAAVPNLQKR